MPEPSDRTDSFPDLAGPAAHATRPPRFEELSERAQRRRRRTRAALGGGVSLAVVAVVAIGVSLGQSKTPAPSASPHRAHPTVLKQGKVSATADTVIAHGTLFRYAVDADGDLLTLWTNCPGGQEFGVKCHFAWRLVADDTVSTGTLTDDSFPQVSGGTGGFAALGSHAVAVAIRRDGTAVPLRKAAARPITAGEVYVAPYGVAAIVDVADATWFPLTSNGRALGVGALDGGTPWALSASGSSPAVSWLVGGSWSRHGLSAGSGVLAVSGDHVVATGARVTDDYRALTSWNVTVDGGTTWTKLPGSALPFKDAISVAATPKGTLYVASSVDGLYRSTDATWTHFVKVPGAAEVGQVAADRSGVVVLAGTGRSAHLLVADDAGHLTSWPMPLR